MTIGEIVKVRIKVVSDQGNCPLVKFSLYNELGIAIIIV